MVSEDMKITHCLCPSIQWVPGAFFPEVKRLGSEADNALASSVEVKDKWSYTSTSLLHGVHNATSSLPFT
jgi:hypothetical protein